MRLDAWEQNCLNPGSPCAQEDTAVILVLLNHFCSSNRTPLHCENYNQQAECDKKLQQSGIFFHGNPPLVVGYSMESHLHTELVCNFFDAHGKKFISPFFYKGANFYCVRVVFLAAAPDKFFSFLNYFLLK